MWTPSDYPAAMRSLPAEIREKAIEIANRLVHEKNIAADSAVEIAVLHAWEWAELRNKGLVEHHRHDFVIPHDNDWAAREELKRNRE
jgi:uncharacterized protein YdaT